jgi:hypothetical protein
MIVGAVIACVAVVLIGSAVTDRVRRKRRAERADRDELTQRDLNQAAPGRDLDDARAHDIHRLGGTVEGATTWEPNWPR